MAPPITTRPSFPHSQSLWTGSFHKPLILIYQRAACNQFSHSVMSDSLKPRGLQHTQASLSITNSWSSPKLMSIESVMPSNHLILCHPFPLPHSIFPNIRVFSNESAHRIRWLKYWSFSFSISPSNECSGLISFRMDWLKCHEVQGTVKSFLQYHSSKASILQCSAFFIVQLSHPYTTTGKTIALTRWTFVSKIMSLLFNMLSRLVITFLTRSKCLLISWLQSPSAVILEHKKIKSATDSTISPSTCQKWWNQLPWSLFSECWILSQHFHSHFHQEAGLFFVTFCNKGSVICIPEVIAISPDNLNSSLCFI